MSSPRMRADRRAHWTRRYLRLNTLLGEAEPGWPGVAATRIVSAATIERWNKKRYRAYQNYNR